MFAIEKKIHKRTEPIDSLCWTEHNIRRKIFHITLNLCNVPHGNGKLGNWEKAENAVRITHNIWRDTHKYINLREQFIQQCSSSSKQPLPWKGSSEVENFVLTQQTQSSLKREQTQRTTQIQRCAHRKQSSVDVAENVRHIPVSSQWNERERQNPNMWFKDDDGAWHCSASTSLFSFLFLFYTNVTFMTSRFQGCIKFGEPF